MIGNCVILNYSYHTLDTNSKIGVQLSVLRLFILYIYYYYLYIQIYLYLSSDNHLMIGICTRLNDKSVTISHYSRLVCHILGSSINIQLPGTIEASMITKTTDSLVIYRSIPLFWIVLCLRSGTVPSVYRGTIKKNGLIKCRLYHVYCVEPALNI